MSVQATVLDDVSFINTATGHRVNLSMREKVWLEPFVTSIGPTMLMCLNLERTYCETSMMMNSDFSIFHACLYLITNIPVRA